jgi:hypothetical protein
MTIQAWTGTLLAASTAWQDCAEKLDGPRKNLAQAQPELLGSRVSPAASAFLTTWEQQVRNLRTRAAAHSDALAQTMYDFAITDAESVERTQQLLMWDDRATRPVGVVGP